MADVLVLGNGISRLLHQTFVLKWQGELWACNRAYLEEDIAPKITRLTGHADVLDEAREHRDQHGLTFKIMGRGREIEPSCPGEFHKDSGTVLVAEALVHPYKTIYVCGYDLGGPDIWSPGLEQQRKRVWIRRWRDMFKQFGHERIRFVGFDHKPALLAKQFRDDAYLKRYSRGVPHIPDPEYIALHQFIYGGDGVMKGEKIVKVRFLKNGYECEMREELAMSYLEKGKIRIIDDEAARKPIDRTGEPEIAGAPKITNRLTVAALQKIAMMKGFAKGDYEGLKKAELVALLEE